MAQYRYVRKSTLWFWGVRGSGGGVPEVGHVGGGPHGGHVGGWSGGVALDFAAVIVVVVVSIASVSPSMAAVSFAVWSY